jgi:hypothetical protein
MTYDADRARWAWLLIAAGLAEITILIAIL